MSRILNTRADSALRSDERSKTSPTKVRTKLAKRARLDRKPTHTKPHADAPEGVSMDYQMGFTSGPSV